MSSEKVILQYIVDGGHHCDPDATYVSVTEEILEEAVEHSISCMTESTKLEFLLEYMYDHYYQLCQQKDSSSSIPVQHLVDSYLDTN